MRTDILRTIQNAEDTTVYDQIVAAIFDDVRLTEKTQLADRLRSKSKPDCPLIKKVGVQERVLENVKEVFTRHGARPVESTEISVLDDPKHINRYVVLCDKLKAGLSKAIHVLLWSKVCVLKLKMYIGMHVRHIQ